MPLIEPVARQDIPTELAIAIERNRAMRTLSSDVPVRIWAHRPELAQRWLGLLEAMHTRSTLDERLRELVRIRIAAITNCHACQIARKSETVSEEDISCLQWSDPRFSPTEQAALHFAELFAADYPSIDEAVFEALAMHFSTAQIVELNMFAALMLAGGRMTYVQRGYDESSPPE